MVGTLIVRASRREKRMRSYPRSLNIGMNGRTCVCGTERDEGSLGMSEQANRVNQTVRCCRHETRILYPNFVVAAPDSA